MHIMMTRRDFSQWLGRGVTVYGATSVLGLSGLYSLACSADNVAADTNEGQTAILLHYAYLLVPLLEPTHVRYREVAARVTLLASQVPEMAALMEGGIAALNSTGKRHWLELPEQEQVEIIQDLAGTPFFNFLHWMSAEIVMRDPKLWAELGYQGSSIEHGGYLYHGFDDIAWLPPAPAGT
jgi:hypothetical protein